MNSGYEKITLRDTEYVLWSNDITLTGSSGLAVNELWIITLSYLDHGDHASENNTILR
jgi:hypothetical protein